MTNSPQFLGLQPPLAWTAILGFVVIAALGALAGVGKIMNLVFPAGGIAVGLLLYFRYPILYIGFTWWLWFLTPLVRRLVDYRSSYTDPSPLLLTPYLVTFITVWTLCRNFPKFVHKGGFPFVLSLIGIIYGFLVGLIFRAPIRVCTVFLQWIAPVLFGFHLFANWRNYPQIKNNIHRVFLWGVLIMGIYGVFQFTMAPEWDKFWLIQAKFPSGGKPAPFEINVWSTMASNRPFGTVMMAGLLLLFIHPNPGAIGLPANGFGYLSFLLSKKRTTWMSWFFGLLVLTGSLKPKVQQRVIITIIITVICVVPLTTLEPFASVIKSRFDSLSELDEDTSAMERQETFASTIDYALVSYFGNGIGGDPMDNGILSNLFELGWLGTIFYMGGMLMLMMSLFQGAEIQKDQFASAARAIFLATFMQFPLGTPHIEVQGMILWTFLTLAIVAKKYMVAQKIQRAEMGNREWGIGDGKWEIEKRE